MARPTTLPMFHPCFLLECFCLQLGLQACCQKPWRRACRKGRIDNHVLCIFFKCNPKRNSEGCYHYNFLFSSFAVAYHIPSMILPCFFFRRHGSSATLQVVPRQTARGWRVRLAYPGVWAPEWQDVIAAIVHREHSLRDLPL